MDTMLYVALSHQTAMRRHIDVVANNLANMNTTAFPVGTRLPMFRITGCCAISQTAS